jgi:hypothetical protein
MPDDNLSLAHRTLIAKKIADAIDAHTVTNNREPFRSHLGASVVGNECLRYQWYHFRWFRADNPDAQRTRIFTAGHAFEPRIRSDMRAIGCTFLDTVDVDTKQISVSDIEGHFGGSCDGVFIAPQFGLIVPTLLEGKTEKHGSAFQALYKKGVAGSHAAHFIQNSIYGYKLGIKYCLYVNENKNTSERYYEMVELDWERAREYIERAFTVIRATEPPERVSNKREFYLCQMCSMVDICHGNEQVIPNCRNCKNAVPIGEAQWRCLHFEQTIPKDFLIVGCPQHVALPR